MKKSYIRINSKINIQTFGNINTEPMETSTHLSNRLDGNLLQAFKENPYTQSLESY